MLGISETGRTTAAARVPRLGGSRLIASDLNVTITIARAKQTIHLFRELWCVEAVARRKYRKRSMGSLKSRARRSITEKTPEKACGWSPIN
jgi:hypothetical protein